MHPTVWPALSHQFGLLPWDVGRLTGVELAAYVAALPKDQV